MNLLRSLLGPPRLRPDWTFASDGSIWRLLPSATGYLVGEMRQEGERTVRFFCLRERDGTLQWPHRALHEPWWLGIEALQDDTLLIHGYAQPNLPEHRGLYALSLKTGDLLWQAPDVTYWFGKSDAVYVVKMVSDRQVAMELDVRTGVIRREYSDSLEELYRLKKSLLDANESFALPHPLEEEELPEAVIRRMRTIDTRYQVIGDLEGIRLRDRVVYNRYTRNAQNPGMMPTLTNRIYVVDCANGRLLHADVLDTSAHIPVPDSFFVKDARLYYIKNGKALTAISLWK